MLLLKRISRVREDVKRLRHIENIAGSKPPVYKNKVWLFGGALILAIIIVLLMLQSGGISQEVAYMTGIFALAGFLWVTEALPLFATAILIIGLEIIFLSNPGGWAGLGFADGVSPAYQTFLAPLSNPVIVLFFGGFVLARAVLKEGVDKAMAGMLLKIFGGKPAMIMLGLMTITAIFSMWMSNTATTAMMITLVVPLMGQLPAGDPFKKGLLLAIPFAANIGGMGTPIASPPNAVAVSYLQQAGFGISFLQWVLIAIPLMVGLLIIAWGLLYFSFQPRDKSIVLQPTSKKIDKRGWYVVIIMVITVGLWLTDKVHGLSTAVVALFPAIAFTATGLLKRSDVDSLEWNILILIMGGIALGEGMKVTGLDQEIVSLLPTEGRLVFFLIVLMTLLMSTFISNTAAANLLLPIGISFAIQQPSIGTIQLGVSIALIASLAMALPVSTPPNTIAYSKGSLTTGDFVKTGAIIGVLAIVLIALMAEPIITFWLNLLPAS